MEVIYYYDPGLEYCPVKGYFDKLIKYDHNIDDCKFRLLTDIKSKIDTIGNNYGRPMGKFSSKLKRYESFEIRQRKTKKTLIRILYFLYQDKMILLHAFEKSENYKTNKEKKEIDKQYKIAEEYIKKYRLNTSLYEKYR